MCALGPWTLVDQVIRQSIISFEWSFSFSISYFIWFWVVLWRFTWYVLTDWLNLRTRVETGKGWDINMWDSSRLRFNYQVVGATRINRSTWDYLLLKFELLEFGLIRHLTTWRKRTIVLWTFLWSTNRSSSMLVKHILCFKLVDFLVIFIWGRIIKFIFWC